MPKASLQQREVELRGEPGDSSAPQVGKGGIGYEPPAVRVLADAARATKGTGTASYDNNLEGYSK
jgi:hypothetical protein